MSGFNAAPPKPVVSVTAEQNAAVIKNHNGNEAIKFLTDRGAMQIGADDAVVIGAGEAAAAIAANINPEVEDLRVGGDNIVEIISNLQDGWGGRHTLKLDASGHLWLDGALVCHDARPAGHRATYALLTYDSTTVKNPGDVLSGSVLRFSNAHGSVGGRPSGTWRLMGYLSGSSDSEGRTSVFMRIS